VTLLRLLASEKQAARSRSRRRAYPIHFYSGRNGSGKSHAAVWDLLPDLDAGMSVLSTVRLLDFRNPRACDDPCCDCDKLDDARHRAAHPGYIRFVHWEQFMNFTEHAGASGRVVMDEITGVADSNDAASMPGAVGNRLAQLRRGDMAVSMTGLNFIRASKRIREACNAVTVCKGLLPITVQGEDGNDKLWRQRRLSVVRTYDAQSLPMDDISAAAYEKADKVGSGRFWIPTSLAVLAYDSLDKVETVGSSSDAGRCVHCSGTRRAQECSCEDYLAVKAARKVATSTGRRTEAAVAPSLVAAGGAFEGGLLS
jgi:hypothetical protein